MFELERQGKAFVFAPSEPVKVGTYTMDEKVERELYDLGWKDFKDRKDDLRKFMEQ